MCFLSHRLCSKQTNSKLLSVSPNSKSINIFFIFLFLHFNVQGLKLTIEQKPNIVEKLFFYSISFISQSYLLTLEWFNLNYILNISTEKKYNEEKQKLQNLIFLFQFFFRWGRRRGWRRRWKSTSSNLWFLESPKHRIRVFESDEFGNGTINNRKLARTIRRFAAW